MQTADYMAMPAAEQDGTGIFAAHVEFDRVPGDSNRIMGIAGGCLDAPEILPAGCTYWYRYKNGGWDMGRGCRRGS